MYIRTKVDVVIMDCMMENSRVIGECVHWS